MHKYAHPIHVFIIHLMHWFHQISYRLLLETIIAIFSVFRFDDSWSLQILLSQKPFTLEPSFLDLRVIYIFIYKTVLGFLDVSFHFYFIACFDKSFRFLLWKCTKITKSQFWVQISRNAMTLLRKNVIFCRISIKWKV